MAEEEVGGLEGVIRIVVDDTDVEAQAEAAVEKVQKAARSKRVKVPVDVAVDSAQVQEEVTKKTRNKKATVKVTPGLRNVV